MAELPEYIEQVAELLKDSEQYPWKTAKYLSKMLAKEGIVVKDETLEAALIEHAQSTDRQIRYSYFPARKSLDLLWGHVAIVQNPNNLPSPHLESEFGDFEPCNIPQDRTWCFLSHSFRDLPEVTRLYDALLERGFGVWLAEAEVMTGMMIGKAVQEGLELCDRFVLYASRNSLASRWVLKEGLQAIGRWNMEVTVVLDSEDRPLLELFGDWMMGRWDGDFKQRIDGLVEDATEDPAATYLSDLLLDGFGRVPVENRKVVLIPFPDEMNGTRFQRFEEAFDKPTS